MKLEINTNGSWRTVLRGLGQQDPAGVQAAKDAAATLAALDTCCKPHTWRLVNEGDGRTVERLAGGGWHSEPTRS